MASDPEPEIQRLIAARPQSHRPATLPREYLPPGEAILFETRPSLWPFVSGVVLGGVLLVILGIIAVVESSAGSTGVGAGSSGQFLQLLGVLAISLGVIAIVLRLVRWLFTSYAITNRRVVRKTGWAGRQIVDARFDKIQCVTVTDTTGSRVRGFGHIHFALSTFSAPLSIYSGVQESGILWFAIPDPIQVRAYVEDVFETFSRFEREGQRLILEEAP